MSIPYTSSMTFRVASKPFLIGAAGVAVVAVASGYALNEGRRAPILEIYVFAMKSGRAMLVRTPDDSRILVNGGGNSEIVRHLTSTLPFYSRRIDTLILTSTDDKDATGLVDVLGRYSIGSVYIPRHTLKDLELASSTGAAYEAFLGRARTLGMPVTKISAGGMIVLDHANKVTLKAIFPASPENFEYSKSSAPEILSAVNYGQNSVVFMGDASKKVQKLVASTHLPDISNSNVLIFSHSASQSNVSDELMRAVRPDYLVYEKTIAKKPAAGSARNQKNGDPLAAILKENRFNLKEGTVKIVSDGTEIKITSAR